MSAEKPASEPPPIPVITVAEAEFSGWLAHQEAQRASWVEANAFEAKSGEHCLLPDSHGGIEGVVAGVGECRGLYSIAQLPGVLPPGRYRLDADWDDPGTRQMALGFELARYRFGRYLGSPSPTAELLMPAAHADEVTALAGAVGLVRDLVNTPAEEMGPDRLGEALSRIAAEHEAEYGQIVGDELLTEGYPAIHAVGRAAGVAPRLLSLRWGRAEDPLVALIGKGVCFDSGGLDLKSADGMRLMKKDMGGAAHAMAVAQLVMQRQLPVRLLVLVPAVENAVAGNAYRPGDVVATRKGLSVEIGNTDAEGRVVLADALTRADEDDPVLIVDFATLTGAARAALGPDLPALFANQDDLAADLLQAGIEVEDPLWRMPLHQPYATWLKSTVADVCNISSVNMGGAITAALFLQQFVDEKRPWCHLDTYAWNRSAQPGRPEGGEALGMRAVFAYLGRRFSQSDD